MEHCCEMKWKWKEWIVDPVYSKFEFSATHMALMT
jgi:hypothetical protein